MNKRVYFVDFARAYAICLALFDHSMNDFHVWENYSFEQYAVLKVFTTSATPTFLFLFGMMLELVYFPRLASSGLGAIKGKMIKRSLQCYAGFIMTSIAGLIGGFLTVKSAIGTAIFVSNNHYGNILKIYCILILAAIPLLMIRKRYGLKSIIGLSLGAWLIYPFTKDIVFQNGSIDIFMSTFFGIGRSSGPSALHAMTIVSLGMLSASFISFTKSRNFIRNNFIMLLLLLGLSFLFLSTMSWESFLDNYFSNTFRRENHPIYYTIALSVAVINVIIFSLLIPVSFKLKNKNSKLLVFGRNSLSAFTLANVILNLIYTYTRDGHFNILYPIVFIIVTYILIIFYEQWKIGRREKRKLSQAALANAA